MYTDTLTRIKNSQAVGRAFLKIPYSKMDRDIVELLVRGGFFKKIDIKGQGYKKIIKIYLNPEKPIKGIRFLSKPSRRLYEGYQTLQSVKGGYGMLILSTSQGIKTGEEAKTAKIGGQLLFEIW